MTKEELEYLDSLVEIIGKIRDQDNKSLLTTRKNIFIEVMQLVKMIEDSKNGK